MLDDWGFPRVFVEAILEASVTCEEPFQTLPRHKQFAAILGSAECLAALFCVDVNQCCAMESPLASAAIDRLGLCKEDLAKLSSDAYGAWDEWRGLFRVTKQEDNLALPLLSKRQPSDGVPAEPFGGTDGPCADDLLILVAEDNIQQRHFLCDMLRAAGHRVIIAENGNQAQWLALEKRPDIVIADWRMPELDGIGLCHALRSTKVGRAIYFILVTAADDEDVLLRAYESGVDDFVIKPFRPRTFHSRMKAAERLIHVEKEMRRERTELRRIAGELSIANRKLETATLTDFLTELPNRRFLMQHLDQQWSAARRNHRELACLLIDVDHFKQVNDRYGHGVGDTVLQTVAVILRDHKPQGGYRLPLRRRGVRRCVAGNSGGHRSRSCRTPPPRDRARSRVTSGLDPSHHHQHRPCVLLKHNGKCERTLGYGRPGSL